LVFWENPLRIFRAESLAFPNFWTLEWFALDVILVKKLDYVVVNEDELVCPVHLTGSKLTCNGSVVDLTKVACLKYHNRCNKDELYDHSEDRDHSKDRDDDLDNK
jgi:hypothetical protein